MPEKVGKCKYEGCNRKVLPNSKYCICHEKRDDKDIEAFNREIEKIMQDKEAEFYDFRGFYFPESFDFEIIYRHLKNNTFEKRIEFRYAMFQGEVYFRGVIFQRFADFRGVIFQKGVDFLGAVFQSWAIFLNATFQECAYFRGGTIFQERAYFESATFQNGANFKDTTFQKQIDFENTTFQGYINFENATFEKMADFRNCEIKETIDFHDARFYDEFLLTDIKGTPKLDFRNTRFSVMTRIGGETNLKNALFNLSNIELVDFTGAQFPKEIYEEKELKKQKKPWHGDWQEVSTIYRKLKQAHQRHGDYAKAGEFFYREMECKRKSYREEQEWHWNRVWLWFYKILCGYGERVKNIVGCSAFIVFLCSFFYYLSGISRVGEEVIKFSFESGFSLRDFGYSIYYSIVTFTSLGYGDIHPLGWSHVIASIEVILGVFFMSLFVVVFVRKMSR